MTSYERMVNRTERLGFNVYELPLKNADGIVIGNNIAINKALDEHKKRCVLAEELSHGLTNIGNITDQENTSNRKQEARARRRCYQWLVSPSKLLRAYTAGARTFEEFAEYLNVTEEFLQESLLDIQKRRGYSIIIEGYRMTFQPFQIEKENTSWSIERGLT